VLTVRILSRASALAVTQAEQVARALQARWPDVSVEFLTRTSAGDRDRVVALSAAGDKGLFTADLSEALASGGADIVVHSWKDLPIAPRPDTVIAGTLPRADTRDVLLVRKDIVNAKPSTLEVLTSSPRRAWQLTSSLRPLLPWPVRQIATKDVRGNIPTRLDKVVRGEGDALVVAKAALDRLLGTDAPSDTKSEVRRALDACRWLVLPVRQFPAAPAQGALAIEVASASGDVISRVQAISDEPTDRACRLERRLLESYGGGCHEAIGATVLVREFGTVTSVRGRRPDGGVIEQWTLDRIQTEPPTTALGAVWPRPDEQVAGERVPRPDHFTWHARGLWIARADALPDEATVDAGHFVWTAGIRTWHKLASRGIWVHGSAEGLGEDGTPAIDVLAGEQLQWERLTHSRSGDPSATATYDLHYTLPEDLASRTHFFWTSGTAFLDAVSLFPAIRTGWHASGPGRTSLTIREALGPTDRASIWLDYDSWLKTVTR
jgi:hydroxymethylbilane synthase